MKLRGNVVLKKIDRIAGIPILRCISIFHKKRPLPPEITKVALLLTPAIGDTILTQALLRDIKSKNPKTQITLFLPHNIISTARLVGFSDAIIPISYSNIFSAIRKIRETKFAVFIDTGQWTRLSAIITFFSKAKHTRGFQTDGQYKHYGYDAAIHHDNIVHEVINIKRLQWGTFSETENLPSIVFKDPKQKSGNWAVIHMKPSGVLSYLKEWDKNNWIAAIKYLTSKGYDIYFSGGPNESGAIADMMRDCGEGNFFDASGKSFAEMALLIRDSTLMISVNTGIMHLAAATDCNLIALHGPVNSKRWGPVSKNAIVIDSPFHSAPCLNLGFEYNCTDRTGECMKAITLQMVIDAIDTIIGAGK